MVVWVRITLELVHDDGDSLVYEVFDEIEFFW
jgi:hypothetical protein